jgi:hypothetical protein
MLMKLSLLRLKFDQSRHEKRHLVIPNERRVTRSGQFLASTRRAGTILLPYFVINRLFNPLNYALSAAQANKMVSGSDSFISIIRP